MCTKDRLSFISLSHGQNSIYNSSMDILVSLNEKIFDFLKKCISSKEKD